MWNSISHVKQIHINNTEWHQYKHHKIEWNQYRHHKIERHQYSPDATRIYELQSFHIVERLELVHRTPISNLIELNIGIGGCCIMEGLDQ